MNEQTPAMLLNGCSYGAAWNHFPGVNLSQHGGSFYRSVRTTIEYCATYGNPSAVLIPITFIDRDEYITQISDDRTIEGPYNKSNTTGELKELNITFNMLHTSDFASYDKLVLTLTMFCAWLEQQNIPYMMWNQCNTFHANRFKNWKAFNKLKYISENNRIINLFEFHANTYMYKQGAKLNDPCTKQPDLTHYSKLDYENILVPYLQNYANKHNLNIPDISNPSLNDTEPLYLADEDVFILPNRLDI